MKICYFGYFGISGDTAVFYSIAVGRQYRLRPGERRPVEANPNALSPRERRR